MHRSHRYQRLVIAGRCHRTVSLLYLALLGVALALGVGWRAARLCALLLWWGVGRVEAAARRSSACSAYSANQS
ncbi:MAG: hypothetical protein ACKO4U_22370 [Caldilinea sp.]